LQLSSVFPKIVNKTNNNNNDNNNHENNNNLGSDQSFNNAYYLDTNNNKNAITTSNNKEILDPYYNNNSSKNNMIYNINEKICESNNTNTNNKNNNTESNTDSLSIKNSEILKSNYRSISRNDSVYSSSSNTNDDYKRNNNKIYENTISNKDLFIYYYEILKNEESHWEDKSDAIEQMSIMLNDDKKIFLANLNELCIILIECISSLRTSFSKASVIFCEKLFTNLGTSMDSKVDIIGGALIKKIGEGNNFITEIIEKALNAMCTYCSWNRTLFTLINSSSQKSSNIRLSIANHIDNIISDLSDQDKQLVILKQTDITERLLITLISLSSDKISLTRKKAKHSIYILFKPIIDNVFINKNKNISSFSNPEEVLEKEIDKVLKKNLSVENKKKLKNIIIEFQSKSLNSFSVQKHKLNTTSSESNSPLNELENNESLAGKKQVISLYIKIYILKSFDVIFLYIV